MRGSSRWMPSWPLLRPAEPAVEQRLPDDRQPVGQGAGPPRSLTTAQAHDPPDLALPLQREDGIFLDQASRQFVAYSRLPDHNWC